GWNLVRAVHAGNFLNQIHLAFQIHAEGRNLKRHRLRRTARSHRTRLAIHSLQTKLAEIKFALLRFQGDTEQFVDLVLAQGDFLRPDRFRIRVHNAFGQFAAGGFQNQLRRALTRPVTDADVRAALEAVAGFAAQTERLAGAADVGRRKIGALDEHVRRRIVYFRVLAAHDSGQGDAFLFVGNQKHFVRQRAFDTVEGFELLSGIGATDDDRRTGILPVSI